MKRLDCKQKDTKNTLALGKENINKFIWSRDTTIFF